ncbi:hypothetical protein BaRGS_00022252, partial [Batillaria attramentaria]
MSPQDLKQEARDTAGDPSTVPGNWLIAPRRSSPGGGRGEDVPLELQQAENNRRTRPRPLGNADR